jgi:hypothetical protein
MAKISVRHSVAEAYGLLFGRPLSVIGLTWMPAVFYAVTADFLIQRMNKAMAASVPAASGLFGEYAFFYFAALLVVTAFFGAVIAVPLTREAFRLREERVAAYFVVGARELRLFFALLRYYVLLASLIALFAIGAGVAISQGMHYAATHNLPTMWQGLPIETWLNSAAGALAVIVLTVLTVRYGFFLDAIAAAEDHARLSRAAVLARGNFWSIATTLLVACVPASLILLAGEMTFGGLNLASLGLASAAATPFAGILAAGLVVLHTLSAGASAGAYAELADAAVHEAESVEISPYAAPAEVYASARQAEVLAAAQTAAQAPEAYAGAHEAVTEAVPEALTGAIPEAMVEPLPEPPQEDATFQAEMSEAAHMAAPMEILTPEAQQGAASLPSLPPGEWLAPPPDAHFGSDPHDAQAHEANAQGAQSPEGVLEATVAPATEPLAAAIKTEETAAAHPVEAQNASAEGHNEPVTADVTADPAAERPIFLPEEHGAPRPPALHPDVQDAAHEEPAAIATFDGQPEEVPDHAHNAEFPPPPLDPAGVLAAAQQAQLPPAA